MIIHTRGIVLNRKPYNDSIFIADILTESYGKVPYRIPLNASPRSKAGKLRRLLTPLTELDLVADHRDNRGIQSIVEAIPSPVRIELLTHPTKRNIAFFLADVLSSLFKNNELEIATYQFISQSLDVIEQAQAGCENFHLAFLLALMPYCGIHPTETIEAPANNRWFSLQDVCFTTTQPSGLSLPPEVAKHLSAFCKMNYHNFHRFQFSAEQRRYILYYLVQFFSIHYAPMPEFSSIDILTELYK